MRYAPIAAAMLLAACGGSSDQDQVNADNAAAGTQPADSNVSDELIDNPNGTQTLRLEGNDSATFVDGELVEVNRAEQRLVANR